MNTEEKAKAYDEAVKVAEELRNSPRTCFDIDQLTEIFPELKESEDERIRKSVIGFLKTIASLKDGKTVSNEDFDSEALLEWASYLEKQKEPLPIPDKFSGLKSLMLQYLQSAANRKDDTEIEDDTDLFGRKILDYVWKYDEKQKEQNSSALQDAFDRSVKDYSLEEKRQASDYAESILPTSITYGESKDEYKLHKIIEAAYIAGQKEQKPYEPCNWPADKDNLTQEQKPAEWSEEDEETLEKLHRILVICRGEKKFIQEADYNKMYNLLKSLRPSWKPNNEQMKALRAASSLSSLGEYVQRHLWSLYEQLKKLGVKEEPEYYQHFDPDC